MNPPSFHFILLSLFMLYLATSMAQGPPTPVASHCPHTDEYTLSDGYAFNLKHALADIATSAPEYDGFYSTSAPEGQYPKQVFGLLQCRGDISSRDCQICANSATSEILQVCPHQTEALIYYDHCWLRYGSNPYNDHPNGAVLDTGDGNYSRTASDRNHYIEKLTSLMNNLSTVAATNSLKFSGGVTSFRRNVSIYGMAQCFRNIPTQDECFRCLRRMVSHIPTCCGRKHGGRVMSKACCIRFEIYPFLQLSPAVPWLAMDSPPSPVAEERRSTYSDSAGGKGRKRILAITATLVLIFFFSVCLIWRKVSKRRINRRLSSTEGKWHPGSLIFDLTTLKVATKNFSDTYKLGEGGFGSVYMGKLFDGSQVAVKRLSQTSTQGVEELKTEVTLLNKLMHKNLVRLLGFCSEKEEKLLIYEYLPNGSLDQFLFDDCKRVLLNWKIRYKIILGITQGLQYLHHDSQLKIIHRDLKASNILLDRDMNAKVSDFGLARLLNCSQIQVNTNRIAGTFGYMAPEYANMGQFSTKSDVFSFGILILEIVTGKKNSSFRHLVNLTSYAWRHWENGTTLEMVDEILGDHWVKNEALKCIHIALLCVQRDAGERPTMSEVILMLGSHSTIFHVPSQPAFYYEDPNTKSPNMNQIPENKVKTEQSTSRKYQQSGIQPITSEVRPR